MTMAWFPYWRSAFVSFCPRRGASLQFLTCVGLLVFTHCICSTLDSHRSFRTHFSQPALPFISCSPSPIWARAGHCQSFCTTGGVTTGLPAVCPALGQLQRMSFVINISSCYSSQQLAWQSWLPLRSSVFSYLPCHPILLAPLQHLAFPPAYLAPLVLSWLHFPSTGSNQATAHFTSASAFSSM